MTMLKKISDREIFVGKNRFYLREDNILYFSIIGKIDREIAELCNKVTYKLLNLSKERTNVLIDLNQAGVVTYKARTIGQNEATNKKIGKVALFGMSPVSMVIASFLIGFIKKKDIHFLDKATTPIVATTES